MSHGVGPEEQRRIDQLARIARFSDFSDAEMRAVGEAGTYLTVPEHWALMVEHTPADKAYLILAGEVSVRRHGEEVARLGPGEIIGEMALLNHKLRSATVVAESRLEALHFTAEAIEQLRATVPHFAETLAEAAAERGPAQE